MSCRTKHSRPRHYLFGEPWKLGRPVPRFALVAAARTFRYDGVPMNADGSCEFDIAQLTASPEAPRPNRNDIELSYEPVSAISTRSPGRSPAGNRNPPTASYSKHVRPSKRSRPAPTGTQPPL